MSRKIYLLAALTLACAPLAVAQVVVPPDGSTDYEFVDDSLPDWQIQAQAVAWTRNVGMNAPLASGVVPQWNVAEMNFGFQYGANVSAARRLRDSRQIEVSWLGVNSWEAGKSRTQLATIVGPGFTYVAGGTHRFVYDTALQSGEVNIKEQRSDRLLTFAGFRYMELSELFTTTSGGTFAYAIDTNNYLYGLQLGADVLLWQAPEHAFDLNGIVKTGVFANRARTDVVAANFVAGTAGDRDRSAAFNVEASLIGTYQLTDHISLRGGYQVMWLTGVALAPAPLAAPNIGAATATNFASADILYHGGLFGLEATY